MIMSKRAEKALRGSIKKWEGIRYRGERDMGIENCPLCQLYCKPEEKFCKPICPVKRKTGRDLCRGTPYDRWLNEIRRLMRGTGVVERRAVTPKQRRIATRMIKFLRSLLPEEGE